MDTGDFRVLVPGAGIAADDAAGAVRGAGYIGVGEGHVVALAIQHAEEAGVIGEVHAEVGNRMAGAVEVDLEVVRAGVVERDPGGHGGHVDVVLHLEVHLVLVLELLGHLFQVFRRGQDVRVFGRAVTALRTCGNLDDGHERVRGAGKDPVVRAFNLVDGDRKHVHLVFHQPGCRDPEPGGRGGLVVARQHHRIVEDFERGGRQQLVVGAVGRVVGGDRFGIHLEGERQVDVGDGLRLGEQVEGLALVREQFDCLVRPVQSGV